MNKINRLENINEKWGKKMIEYNEKMIDLGFSKFMMNTRETFAKRNHSYIEQEKICMEAEKRYESLKMEDKEKEVVEKYIQKIRELEQQYGDLSYMAGMRDGILLLSSLGFLEVDMDALSKG